MTATRLALFIKKNLKGCCFFVFIGPQARDEVDAKASTSYTAQGAVFTLSERRSCARRFEVSPAVSMVAPALNGIFSFFK